MSLENLPDELILNILGYVTIQDKINCGQTSKRIRAITQDETLWQRVDGGFQLAFVSISRVINHMTCYKFQCSHWLKLQHSDWKANLVKDFFLNKFSTNESI